MEKYGRLKKHLEERGLKIKEKPQKNKPFKTWPTKDKDALLEQMAKDLGYIQE